MDYIIQLSAATDLVPGQVKWFPALQAKTIHTKRYGPLDISKTKLENFVKNFKNNVRGIEVATDYEHGLDPSKGTKASGWIKDMKVEGDQLHVGVAFTEPAVQELQRDEWKYFSLEFEDNYLVTDTGERIPDVVTGGGLTNKPVAKGLPINFSELGLDADPTITEFADLTANARNDLPDSAFMYIEPGQKGAGGKSDPGKRHFPYKTASGAIDIEHVRKIAQLAPRADLPPSVIHDVISRAHAILAQHTKPTTMHEEGGEMTETEKRLRKLLGLSEISNDDAVEEAIKKFSESNSNAADTVKLAEVTTELEALKAEVAPLKQLKEQIDGKKKFADEYPEEHKQMTELREANRRMESRAFADEYRTIRFSDVRIEKVKDASGVETDKEIVVPTTKGLSGLALQKIEETSLKFADGTVSLSDFKDTVDAIMKNGIVDYGTKGTTAGAELQDDPAKGVNPIGNVLEIRTRFSDLVTDRMAQDKLEFDDALKLVAEDNPELWAAYKDPALSGAMR